jgi:SSS family solute:Na+ symporter
MACGDFLMNETKLSALDFVIVGAYLAGTIGLGLWVGRRVHSGSDFFLAGRRLPWWMIGISLVATDIGGTDVIGVGGAAYLHGLAVGNFEWIGCVPAMIVAAFVFVPFFWRLGIYTIPEYLERRFNVAVRVALATCWLAFMACNLGVMFLASAKMTAGLFGWNMSVCLIGSAILVGVYTCAGGLAADVYTDVMQGVIMIAGCLFVLVVGVVNLGGVEEARLRILRHEFAEQNGLVDEWKEAGLSTWEMEARLAALDVTPNARAEHAKLILPVDSQTPFPWTGIFFGLALVLSPAYWIGNQAIVQRSLGARSEYDAKVAYVWGALLKNVIPVTIALPGLLAFAKFPGLEDGDLAIPRLVGELLPIGAKGVFFAAFLAALMSTVDSYLNSAATIISRDLYQRFLRPQTSDVELLKIGRATTAGLTLWGISFAFYLATLEGTGIYTIFQTLMAFFQGPALAVLATGLLWKRATGPAALVGFVSGVATSITLFALNQPAVCELLGLSPLFQIREPFLYFSVWAFLVALALIVVVSLGTQREPDEKIRQLVYHRSTPTAPGYLRIEERLR